MSELPLYFDKVPGTLEGLYERAWKLAESVRKPKLPK